MNVQQEYIFAPTCSYRETRKIHIFITRKSIYTNEVFELHFGINSENQQ